LDEANRHQGLKAMKPNMDKLPDMIRFVVARAPHPPGKTKLVKMLWEADIEAKRRLGRSISGRRSYLRMPYGPMPAGFDKTVSDLQERGLIRQKKTSVGDFIETRVLPGDEDAPEFENFTPEEVDILHLAIRRIAPLSAKSASERTHDVLWEETPTGAEISIGAAAVIHGEITEDVLAWANSLREEIAREEAV
jgi:hypothetical protein